MMTELNHKSSLRKIFPTVLLAGSLTSFGVAALPAQSTPNQDLTQADSANSSQRTDSQIETDVVHSLDVEASLKNDWITAGTVQGEVTLSGTSASEANRKLAESIASKVAGVTKVVNDLKVGNPQQAEDAASAAEPASEPQPAEQNQPIADNNQQPSPQPAQQSQQSQQADQGPRPNYRPFAAHPLPPQRQMQEAPFAPVTIEQGALVKVRTAEPLDSKRAVDGAPVEFTVARDVYAAGVLAIPRGATIRGRVTDIKKSGALGGKPELALQLSTLELGGHSYPIDTESFIVKGPNKAGRTVNNAVGGAILGAIIGGAVGGGSGAAIGAGAGAAGGTAASAATPGPRAWIPSEAVMDFHLSTELTVTPVCAQEAQRLATNAPSLRGERPTLYRRGPYRYPPPPPPPGYY